MSVWLEVFGGEGVNIFNFRCLIQLLEWEESKTPRRLIDSSQIRVFGGREGGPITK